MPKTMKKILFIAAFFATIQVVAQDLSKFKQLREELPTPNTYRTASGAPGHEYWQQRADYKIQVELDDVRQRIVGSEEITYFNNSPDVLTYIWVQIDQNIFDQNGYSQRSQTGSLGEEISFWRVEGMFNSENFQGVCNIKDVSYKSGKKLSHTINNTMMRIDLPEPLRPKQYFSFDISWEFNINNARKLRARTGYEFFEADSNYIYTMAQWFPRLCVYSDYLGWQNKQFLGTGEFTLPFGNYTVGITAPADHIVAATGELQNPNNVLTGEQRRRIAAARRNNDTTTLIVTPDEALKNEKSRSNKKVTWNYYAENVRDFAFASSRKFIWDAQNVKINQKDVLAMSFYPKEGNPLWGQYSTKAVVQAIKTYSKYTINYPYATAISVNGPIGGMEYPMICFNGPRPKADGTYTERTRNALISVVIHEVGHNFFPMIINSDERQWSWMDEGLNTFVQYLAEQEFEPNYASQRGPAAKIVPYMKSDKSVLEPIMTNSESIAQFGNNAYGKPATALNILRETVMGKELFDYAFKEYCRRWAFKHPEPADFFRTMEDASAVDLDWFWNGWFYTTQNVDVALSEVKATYFNTKTMKLEQSNFNAKTDTAQSFLQKLFKFEIKSDSLALKNNQAFLDFYKNLNDSQEKMVEQGYYLYELTLLNKGGLVMPLIAQINYTDSTSEVRRYPAEVWVKNNDKINKIIATTKPVQQFILDPFAETADVNTNNNALPAIITPTRIEKFKAKN